MEKKILMVCLGNICRSPLAEVLLRNKAFEAGYSIQVDSAGLLDYHEGENPDPRSVHNARINGVDISAVVSRPVREPDFESHDFLFAMDESVLSQLRAIADPRYHPKMILFLPFCGIRKQNVPDPYTGTEEDFQAVFELLDDATGRLLNKLAGL